MQISFSASVDANEIRPKATWLGNRPSIILMLNDDMSLIITTLEAQRIIDALTPYVEERD